MAGGRDSSPRRCGDFLSQIDVIFPKYRICLARFGPAPYNPRTFQSPGGSCGSSSGLSRPRLRGRHYPDDPPDSGPARLGTVGMPFIHERPIQASIPVASVTVRFLQLFLQSGYLLQSGDLSDSNAATPAPLHTRDRTGFDTECSVASASPRCLRQSRQSCRRFLNVFRHIHAYLPKCRYGGHDG